MQLILPATYNTEVSMVLRQTNDHRLMKNLDTSLTTSEMFIIATTKYSIASTIMAISYISVRKYNTTINWLQVNMETTHSSGNRSMNVIISAYKPLTSDSILFFLSFCSTRLVNTFLHHYHYLANARVTSTFIKLQSCINADSYVRNCNNYLLYGVECWTPLMKHYRTLNTFLHRCFRIILGIGSSGLSTSLWQR